ncbi:unnamed protein product [Clonostachys byssicola]|uniref:Uncharacterized protein n=1 Tax=Clonostachys byssicola TaxID=160290 RepID=A0A9N9UDL9_9HYPO|nr:unnamed protein product [Clonostachys byssicola]
MSNKVSIVPGEYRVMPRGGDVDMHCFIPAKRTDRRRFPPAFWDNLSQVHLTPRALKEHDRRNKTHASSKRKAPGDSFHNIAKFARHGGPDLGDIRGYSRQRASTRATSPDGRPGLSRRSVAGMTETDDSGPPSPYDHNFGQHLIDNNIWVSCCWAHLYWRPRNYEDLRLLMPAREKSQVPFDQFSRRNENFVEWEYQNWHDEMKSERDVMIEIIPKIAGPDHPLPKNRNVYFSNMDAMTDLKVRPAPIFYDGASYKDLHPSVLSDLDSLIVPSKTRAHPVAPNLFLEAKPLWRGTGIAVRKACLDGAYGARAMHALQNYNREVPVYDGNAYAYSFVYNPINAALKIYAHYITAPRTPGGRPHYHMKKIKGFWMTMDVETFINGALAFREIRKLAKAHRDRFIEEANDRASELTAIGSEHVGS